jgi:hypothetical protein
MNKEDKFPLSTWLTLDQSLQKHFVNSFDNNSDLLVKVEIRLKD